MSAIDHAAEMFFATAGPAGMSAWERRLYVYYRNSAHRAARRLNRRTAAEEKK